MSKKRRSRQLSESIKLKNRVFSIVKHKEKAEYFLGHTLCRKIQHVRKKTHKEVFEAQNNTIMSRIFTIFPRPAKPAIINLTFERPGFSLIIPLIAGSC